MAPSFDGRTVRYLVEEEQDIYAKRLLAQEARTGIAEWMAGLERWDLYATFTYDPARFVPDADCSETMAYVRSHAACLADLETYRKGLSAVLHRPVRAAAAVEEHRNGWPHAHALLCMDGINSRGFVRAGRLWWDNHGFALLQRVAAADAYAVSAYITKYFTKQNADVALLGPLKGSNNV